MQEVLFNSYLESSVESLTIPEPVLVGLMALAATAAVAALFLVAIYIEMIAAEIKHDARERAALAAPEPPPRRTRFWLSLDRKVRLFRGV